jgi:hypothetical protein
VASVSPRVNPLARGFEFYEPDQRVVESDTVVRADAILGKAVLASQDRFTQLRVARELDDQLLEGTAQKILWLSAASVEPFRNLDTKLLDRVHGRTHERAIISYAPDTARRSRGRSA